MIKKKIMHNVRIQNEIVKKNMKEYTQMTMNDPHLPTMEPKKQNKNGREKIKDELGSLFLCLLETFR